jgi:DNA-directed RNA polymerase subunit RPC12/RpoP
MDTPVEVLVCTKCGAPLTLGDGETTTCKRCGTETVVPERHRRLRELRSKDAALRAEGDAMFERLDRPPSLLTGVVAMALDLNMLAFLFFYGIPVGLASVLWALDATTSLARYRHVSEAQIPFAVTMAFAGLLLLVLLFIPRALGVYANRRASGRLILVQGLAAKLPSTPGGPSTCRVCGAPLEIRENARVCDCIYCGAENAVRIRSKLLARTQKAVVARGETVADALRTDGAERKETRAKLWSELGRYVIRIVTLCGLFGLTGLSDRHEGSQGMREASTATYVSAAAVVALVGCIFFFIYRSMKANGDDDGPQRRAGNPAPEWVRVVGPIVFLFLIYIVFTHHC